MSALILYKLLYNEIIITEGIKGKGTKATFPPLYAVYRNVLAKLSNVKEKSPFVLSFLQ